MDCGNWYSNIIIFLYETDDVVGEQGERMSLNTNLCYMNCYYSIVTLHIRNLMPWSNATALCSHGTRNKAELSELCDGWGTS